jgi:hypothetical protein
MKLRSSSAFQPAVSIILFTAFFFVLCVPQTWAQQQAGAWKNVWATPLITQSVDESRLTVLKGNTHPLARPQFDLGTAPAMLPMQRMLLVLKRSAAQELALRTLIDSQQDKASPSYHKWLMPEEFGKQFGPSDADIQIITAWLQSHGFQVGTTKGRTVLEFSGSASQVREAFHTTIHKYVVNEEQHWANSSDPSIPTALTPAVAGVLTLHNFLKKPQIRMSKEPVTAKVMHGKRPEITFTDGTHGLGPQDFATIYHSPAFSGGVTGSGVTVAVIGRSNLWNGGQDIDDFADNLFECCGRFEIVLNGPDPGDLGGGEEAEATLDTTWSNSVAYGAETELIVSATTNTTDGIDLSEVYAIETNLADVMTESFGTCEALSTSTQALGTSALAEQAAAQGITYFVSAGDNGAEGCDDQDSEAVASGPVSVNLLASTPYSVAVGGTVFNDNGTSSTYWSSTNTNQESALSYIPEDVWNDSCLESSCGTDANIVAGSGGTSAFFTKPSWQAGVTGILNDGTRDLPDVALTASLHDGYVLCLEGSCEPNSQGELSLYLVGGTSASAPSFASIMALIDQQMENLNPSQGPRQGQANYVFYRLAALQNASLQCNGSNTSALPVSTCIFNDITIGNNAVPGELNYGSSNADYQAGTGYDMATGLGSVNVANLITQWNTATFRPTTTTLSFSPSSTVHGSSVNVNITVTPGSGSGIPTGDVALITGISSLFSAGFFPLAGGSVSSTTNSLPGGFYFLQARYGGDATFAPSVSEESPYIKVSPEPSTATLSVLTFTSNGTQLNFTNGPFGSFVYLRADVAGKSGFGVPTGSVSFADTFGPIPGSSLGIYVLALNSQGNTATPNGVTFDSGTHTITATYNGDGSFNPSNTTPPLSFTVQPGFFAAVPSNQSTVNVSAPGSSGSSSVSVSYSTGFSGAISLACSGLPSRASCTFSPASITATGTLATTSSTITVTTSATTTGELRTRRRNYLAFWLPAGGLGLFSIVLTGGVRRRYASLMLVALLAMVMFVPACGGGGGGGGTPPPAQTPGTPTGTYGVTVTANSGSVTSTTGFTLVVQ